MKTIVNKYKMLISYGIFGVLTTIINIVIYSVCFKTFHFSNSVSNIIAWIIAVLFAFITNKLYVFERKTLNKKILTSEFTKFIEARLATGFFDFAVMYVGVDLMNSSAIALKVISNVIVIILNYILSKLVVFKKN